MNEAPDFIRDSELDLNEKAYLADAYVDGIAEETILEATRLATKRLVDRKRILEKACPEELKQLRPILTLSLDQILNQALQQTAAEHDRKRQEQTTQQEREAAELLLSNPGELAKAISKHFAETSLKHWRINNRPALDVLLTRLWSLPEPELKLVAAHLIGQKELALKVWFQSMRNDSEVVQQKDG